MATIIGTPADDILNGTVDDDLIEGLGGNDLITGGSGNDTIAPGPSAPGTGNDVVDGGTGYDILVMAGVEDTAGYAGPLFHDTASGFASFTDTSSATVTTVTYTGIEEIRGTDFIGTEQAARSDFFVLGGTIEVARGNGGADFFRHSTNIETVYGGSGHGDFFRGTAAQLDGDTIGDFESSDSLRIQSSGASLDLTFDASDIGYVQNPGEGTLTIDTDGDGTADVTLTMIGDFTGGEFVPLTETFDAGGISFDQTFLYFRPFASQRLSGTDGHDTFRGGFGNDVLRGRGGDDQLTGFDGNDRLFGGAGNDLVGGGAGNDLLFGGAGDDTLFAGTGHDFLFGGGGTDTFEANTNLGNSVDGNITVKAALGLIFTGGGDVIFARSIEVFSGTDQDDRFYGNRRDWIYNGNEGDDRFFGGRGDETMDGGEGEDTFNAGRGDDTVTGGQDADRFIIGLTGDSDTITDFEVGTDDVDLLGGLSDTGFFESDVDGDTVLDTVIDLSNGETLTLLGVNGLTDLTDVFDPMP